MNTARSIEHLPDAVLIRIVSYLSFKERARFSCVSRLCRSICREAYAWDTFIDFKPLAKCLTDSVAETLFPLLRSCQEIDLSNCTRLSSRSLRHLPSHCPDVKKVILRGTAADFFSVYHFITLCPNLTTLDCNGTRLSCRDYCRLRGRQCRSGICRWVPDDVPTLCRPLRPGFVFHAGHLFQLPETSWDTVFRPGEVAIEALIFAVETWGSDALCLEEMVRAVFARRLFDPIVILELLPSCSHDVEELVPLAVELLWQRWMDSLLSPSLAEFHALSTRVLEHSCGAQLVAELRRRGFLHWSAISPTSVAQSIRAGRISAECVIALIRVGYTRWSEVLAPVENRRHGDDLGCMLFARMLEGPHGDVLGSLLLDRGILSAERWNEYPADVLLTECLPRLGTDFVHKLTLVGYNRWKELQPSRAIFESMIKGSPQCDCDLTCGACGRGLISTDVHSGRPVWLAGQGGCCCLVCTLLVAGWNRFNDCDPVHLPLHSPQIIRLLFSAGYTRLAEVPAAAIISQGSDLVYVFAESKYPDIRWNEVEPTAVLPSAAPTTIRILSAVGYVRWNEVSPTDLMRVCDGSAKFPSVALVRELAAVGYNRWNELDPMHLFNVLDRVMLEASKSAGIDLLWRRSLCSTDSVSADSLGWDVLLRENHVQRRERDAFLGFVDELESAGYTRLRLDDDGNRQLRRRLKDLGMLVVCETTAGRKRWRRNTQAVPTHA